MGCGASDIESGLTIELINRSRDVCIYLAGEHVESTVQFDSKLYDPDEKLKGAFIELLGQVVYTTSSTTVSTNSFANGGVSHSTHTTYTVHKKPFFSQRHDIYPELTWENPMTMSQFGRSDEWSFNFILPDELPPSLLPVGGYHSSHPYIEYFIRVVLELDKWYQSNIRHSIPITIYPRINIQNDLYHPIEMEDENRKHVHLRVNITQSAIFPGIPFTIHYDLHNPNRSAVQAIIVKLYQHRAMGTGDSYRTVIFDMDVLDGNENNKENSHDNFNLTLPVHHLPPTSFYTFDNGIGLTKFNPTSVAYELKIEAKLSGFFTDFSLKCPIIMGTEPSERSSPPSYASAMKLP